MNIHQSEAGAINMKIINRKEFLAMPSGTVYAKFTPADFFGDMCVKHDTWTNDWIYQTLNDFDNWHNSAERYIRIDDMVGNGVSYPLLYDSSSRDGFFDEDQLFAIWEKEDIVKLVNLLNKLVK